MTHKSCLELRILRWCRRHAPKRSQAPAACCCQQHSRLFAPHRRCCCPFANESLITRLKSTCVCIRYTALAFAPLHHVRVVSSDEEAQGNNSPHHPTPQSPPNPSRPLPGPMAPKPSRNLRFHHRRPRPRHRRHRTRQINFLHPRHLPPPRPILPPRPPPQIPRVNSATS